MDGKKPLQYHKSPSRASRVVCETLNSEKLVWLTPVSSPLLSPSREKKQVSRRNVKQGSIFALPRRAKVSIEAEEPTSPKVSCIGQVRTSKKNIFPDSKTGKGLHFKPSSASPSRFFSSPGGQSKWGSLFRSHKDAHFAAPSSLGYCGGEVSCFGTSRDSPSGYNSERSCSAFFAKSLLLLQQCEERAECSKSVAQTHAYAHAAHVHTHNGVVEKQVESIVPIPSKQSTYEDGDTHAFRVADTSSEPKAIQQEDSYCHETLTDKHAHENSPLKFNGPTDLCDAEKHGSLALPSIEHLQERSSKLCEAEKNILLVLPFEEKQQCFEQVPTCEELHGIGCNKQNLKVSAVEVAPEACLCRNDEDSKHNGALLVNDVCDEIVRGSRRDQLRKAQGEEGLTPPSCDEECSSRGEEVLTLSFCNEECSLHETTGCHRHEVSSSQSQMTATHSSASSLTMLDNDITCKAFKSEDSSYIAMCGLEEEENANVEIQNKGHEHDTQRHVTCHREEHAVEGSHVLEHVPSSGYTCNTDSWGHYRMALPQLCEQDLHCFHLGKGAPFVWGEHGTTSGDAFLLLDCNLSKSFAWFKDERDKVSSTCEVGEVSNGIRRQLHWLEGEAKLIRSRSATSYHSVIQLQRCKSEPGRFY